MRKRTKEWWKEINDRRSERYSLQGEKLEQFVAKILSNMKEQCKIVDFIHHKKHSTEDCSGKDFSVTFTSSKSDISTYHFGVTISLRNFRDHEIRHPGVKQFCFPIGTNTITIEKRILGLQQEDQIP